MLPSREENMSLSVLSALGATVLLTEAERARFGKPSDPSSVTLTNWSCTHEATTQRFFQPTSTAELEAIVQEAHSLGLRLRAVGTALSPNGIGLSDDGMVSLAGVNKIIRVDKERMQVRVEAGARVEDVVAALRPYGLTMQVFASIATQQIGGYTQVGAHGTGARIPPVDEQVVAMRLITPGQGPMELSDALNPELFQMAKQGLGALGIVSEVTLQCIPAHRLLEQSSVMTRKEVRAGHTERLQKYRHVRYNWFPSADAVCVVTCSPVSESEAAASQPLVITNESRHRALEPLRALVRKTNPGVDDASLEGLSFADLRMLILESGPLDRALVQECNEAEAAYYRSTQGITKIDFSDRVLGFDCGGQQWVYELAFPMGTIDAPTSKDLDFVDDLLKMIEQSDIPAHPTIEQRWTCESKSPMSIVHATDSGALFSWVGIIMFLSSADTHIRRQVTDEFRRYHTVMHDRLAGAYAAEPHWAKLPLPEDEEGLVRLRDRKSVV